MTGLLVLQHSRAFDLQGLCLVLSVLSASCHASTIGMLSVRAGQQPSTLHQFLSSKVGFVKSGKFSW